MTNPPDAAVDVNASNKRSGLAQPHTLVGSTRVKGVQEYKSLGRLFHSFTLVLFNPFHRRRRWVDLSPEQRQILLSIKK
jgi:hypothetical protein